MQMCCHIALIDSRFPSGPSHIIASVPGEIFISVGDLVCNFFKPFRMISDRVIQHEEH